MYKPLTVDLKGKSALVTGGGTGIGQAISIALARCGARVVVNYSRSMKEAQDTVTKIKNSGGFAVAIRADVTKESQVKHLIKKTVRAIGGLDILMANAGGPTEKSPTSALSSKEWDLGLNLNCRSVFYCVKHAIPLLPNKKGRIIITSSISARSGGGPGTITYTAAKGSLNNLVRGWAKELGPRGITVNAISPGIIWTRIHQQRTPPKLYKNLIKNVPLKRDGQPEDCVGPVLLLASKEGSYVTGQTIEINGGLLMP